METFEQKYNAALTWMRDIYPYLTGANKEDAEHYFPELKESEDERIRKYLIDVVKDYCKGSECEGCIAWLEKQKEQKPISSCDIVPYIDDKIAALQDMWREEKVAFDWDDMHEMIEDVARHFYQKEQQPAEWNDSVAKEMFIKALERAVEQTKKGYELTDCDKHSWWEDFKAYSGINPAEWSEEDEAMLNAIIKRYGFAVESDCAAFIKTERLTQMEKELDWLNSLRGHSEIPNNHWKPSEHQLEVLKFVAEKDGTCLMGLYNDLKKL